MATTSWAAQTDPAGGRRHGAPSWEPFRSGDRAETVVLTPLGRGDRAAVRRFLEELSTASRTLRFGTPVPRIEDRLVDTLSTCDGFHRIAWGAWSDAALVGMGELVRLASDPAAAEFALTVADPWQGRGLGRALLERLVLAAACAGVDRLAYYVTGSNRRMLRLLDSVGERYRIRGGAAEGFIPVASLLAAAGPAHAAGSAYAA